MLRIIIFGGIFGCVLAICGILFTSWQFWALLVPFTIANAWPK